MLVLTRKQGESVIIGDNIKVTILQVQGSNIRVGIEAPSEISVHREEIFNKIQEGKNEVIEN